MEGEEGDDASSEEELAPLGEVFEELSGGEAEQVALEVMEARILPTEQSRRFFVSIQVVGKKLAALLDDGAELTMIDRQEVIERGLTTTTLPVPLTLGVAVRGQGTAISEVVVALPLKKGTWKEKRRALVVPNAAAPLILGADWFDEWMPEFDRRGGRVWLSGMQEPWRALPRRPNPDVWEVELGVQAEEAAVEVKRTGERETGERKCGGGFRGCRTV